MENAQPVQPVPASFLEDLDEHIVDLNSEFFALEQDAGDEKRADRLQALIRTAHGLYEAARAACPAADSGRGDTHRHAGDRAAPATAGGPGRRAASGPPAAPATGPRTDGPHAPRRPDQRDVGGPPEDRAGAAGPRTRSG